MWEGKSTRVNVKLSGNQIKKYNKEMNHVSS